MSKTYRKNRLEVISKIEEAKLEYVHALAEVAYNFAEPETKRQFVFGLNPFKWFREVPIESEGEAVYKLFDEMWEEMPDLDDLLEKAKASKAKTITLTEEEYWTVYAFDELEFV